MRYAIDNDEPFPSAVKRIAVEQIELALDSLGKYSEDLSKSIHTARQNLKRIRALLALARGELGYKVFEREWTCYRSAGKLLAAGRDASALVETLDDLGQRFAYAGDMDAFASQRRFLTERRDARLKIMLEEAEALKKSSDMLVSARERVPTWPLEHEGFKAVRGGLISLYRKGREGLRGVVAHQSPTNFHKWRRSVKLLWHQLQLLTPIWPAMLSAYGDELHALSDRLNENHDLYLLQQVLIQRQVEAQSENCQVIIDLAGGRCRELETQALPLGKLLYTERPRHFTDRTELYWRASRTRGEAVASTPTRSSALSAGATKPVHAVVSDWI